ncbi:MAG: glyoxalase [Crenarchaeota archaeon]|nr:glyoxalase [Thermoproteota archaeon]
MFENLSYDSPKYQAAVFFVSDVKRSRRFYVEILSQKVISDFGANVSFEGGLSIWEKNYALNTIFKEKANLINVGSNNSEIYFEVSDLERLFQRIEKDKTSIIHPIIEHPWGQRAFRIYDPDNHIIEVAEPMQEVVKRCCNQGLSLEEINKKTMMPIEFIKMVLQQK